MQLPSELGLDREASWGSFDPAVLQQHHLAAPVAPPEDLQAPAARAAGRQAGRHSSQGGRQAGAHVARMQQGASNRPTASQPAAGGVQQLPQGARSSRNPEHGASHLADGRSSGQGPRQSHLAGDRSGSSLAAPPGPTTQGLGALQALLADTEAPRSGQTSPALTSFTEVHDPGQSLAGPQAEQAGLQGGAPELNSTATAQAERSESLTGGVGWVTPAAAQAEHAGLLSGTSGRDSPAAARTERYGLLGDTSGLESPAADSSGSWQPSTHSEALHAALTAAADRAATGQAGSSASAATPDVGTDSPGQHPPQASEQQGAALGPGRQARTQPHSLRQGSATGQSGVAGWPLNPAPTCLATLHADPCRTSGCTHNLLQQMSAASLPAQQPSTLWHFGCSLRAGMWHQTRHLPAAAPGII